MTQSYDEFGGDWDPVAFKALIDKKERSKPWQKFLAKLDAHKTKPVDDWDHYQLLGYAVSRSAIRIQYEGTEPRFHPQVMKMRRLIALLSGSVWLPTPAKKATYQGYYHPHEVKAFLDWALNKMEQRGQVMRSLGFLLHENLTEDEVIQDRPWIDAWREGVGYRATRPQEHDEKGLDPALLDVDGIE